MSDGAADLSSLTQRSGVTRQEVDAMQCPVDGATLLLSERQSVEIDYCPQCRGVWLDRGELDKLLQRAEGEWDDDDDRERQRARGSRESYPPKKKRKGWLSEMFETD